MRRFLLLSAGLLFVAAIAVYLSLPKVELGKAPSPMPPIVVDPGVREGITSDFCTLGGAIHPEHALQNVDFTTRLNEQFPPGSSPAGLEERLRSEGFEITPCDHDTGTVVAQYAGNVPGRGVVWVVYSTWPNDELQWSLGWVQIVK